MTQKFKSLPSHLQSSALSVIEHQFQNINLAGCHGQIQADKIVETIKSAYLKLHNEELTHDSINQVVEQKTNIMVHGGTINVGVK